MEMPYLIIGQILGTFGKSGEVKVRPLTDFPQRFNDLREVYLEKANKERITLQIEKVREKQGTIYLKFAGYNDITESSLLRGGLIQIKKKEAYPLPEGHYYVFQLLELAVYSEEGNFLGKIKEIIPTISNDVYIVEKDGKELLIPALKEVVKKIDLEGGKVVVKLLEGL